MRTESHDQLIQAKTIEQRIQNQFIGKKVFSFNKLATTNEFAKRIAKENLVEGTLVIADQQTRGRGRLQRKWFSPPSTGLWFSIILKPENHLDKLGIISLLASVAIAESLENKLGLNPVLKWPNDILINNKKVCGILTETEYRNEELSYLVLGIGINVNQALADFPSEIRRIATSLRLEFGRPIARLSILIETLHYLEKYYLAFLKGNFELILNEWTRRCPFIQENIVVEERNGVIAGVFENLDDSGRLLLLLPNGEIRRISVGELQVKDGK